LIASGRDIFFFFFHRSANDDNRKKDDDDNILIIDEFTLFYLVVEMMTIFEIEGSPHDDRRPTVCPALVWSGQFSAKRNKIK
jgi:hypothetical protein